MYRLMVDGKRLHDTDFADYVVEKPTLKLAANKLCTLTFTIYNNNPQFDQIQKLRSVITVYRDSDIIAKVRPIKTKLNFRGGLEYTCEDMLGKLNDMIRRPSYYSGTQGEYLSDMLDAFMNGNSDPFSFEHLGSRALSYGSRGSDVREMQSSLMTLGYNLGSYGADGIFGSYTQGAVKAFEKAEGRPVNGVFDTSGDYDALLAHFTPEPVTEINPITFSAGTTPHSGTDDVEFINDDYVGYWDLLQRNLVEKYGGYLVPVWGDTTCAINYVGDGDLTQSAQTIEFGQNLDSVFIEQDAENTFSVLIPLGKDVKATGIHTGQAENTPLTIKSVNSGSDYLESEDGLTLYGRRERTMQWSDIDNAADLKAKGQEYLSENAVKLKEKVTLSAYDLHYADISIDSLNFMDKIDVKSAIHSLSETYPITEMQLTLNAPTSSKLTLGAETMTLTDRIRGETRVTDRQFFGITKRLFGLENPPEVTP